MDQEHLASKPESWRVVVFTNVPGGVAYTQLDELLRRLGHSIVGVVTTSGPNQRRSRAYLDPVAAVPLGVDIIATHPERWAAMLAPLHPDLIISLSFPWRIPANVLALPGLGAINGHPCLLPQYRGPKPLPWALRSGDADLGYTVHWMTPGFGIGPILAQRRIAIADDESGGELQERLRGLAPGLFQHAFERIKRGERGEPEDETYASYARLLEDEWRWIDWTRPARQIHNQVLS
jgi:methionyl-tRNA formyltransferase